LRAATGPGRGVRVIPLYHSVGQPLENSLDRDVFTRQMSLLAERFRVVRLCDLAAAMTDAGPANVAVVTFDDGIRDNHEVALPILERIGLKATFFVTTGFVGGRISTSAGQCPMMTWSQVRELARLGHEVGAHTVSHPKLTQVSPDVAAAEIGDSKRALEDAMGAEVPSFAYPKGRLDDRIASMVGEAGFRWAVTTEPALVGSSPDWLQLPRVWIDRHCAPGEFLAKVSPAETWYRRLDRASRRLVPR
jgi:peptidoglycan/xylan/chitin deacetylase (PgdA/CDA1 family)